MSHPSTAEPTSSPARPNVFPTFYVGAGAFVILLCVLGFGPSLVNQAGRRAPLTPIVIAHGLVSSAWLLLFLAQATLVAARRTALHRRLGPAGVVLTIATVVLGYVATLALARRGFDLSGDLTPPGLAMLPLAERAAGVLPPLAGLMTFGALAIAGVWYRHRPAVHKRLMVLALIALVPVPLIHLAGSLARHWPAAQGPLMIAVLITANLLPFSVAVHDWISQRRIHPVSLGVPVLMIVQVIVTHTLVLPSAAWRDISVRLVGSVP
jgi:hypothetical protein